MEVQRQDNVIMTVSVMYRWVLLVGIFYISCLVEDRCSLNTVFASPCIRIVVEKNHPCVNSFALEFRANVRCYVLVTVGMHARAGHGPMAPDALKGTATAGNRALRNLNSNHARRAFHPPFLCRIYVVSLPWSLSQSFRQK